MGRAILRYELLNINSYIDEVYLVAKFPDTLGLSMKYSAEAFMAPWSTLTQYCEM
jgi:hypothetical protein